jgi:hypothetical protein
MRIVSLHNEAFATPSINTSPSFPLYVGQGGLVVLAQAGLSMHRHGIDTRVHLP